MDFSKVNILKTLKSGMYNRFMDFPPLDFEDFIAHIFRTNDYEVEQTKYSGDYGVDLIIKKGIKNIAVQVKRYSKDVRVSVKDVNQVRGGSGYYKCKGSMIITTSSFTKPATNLAKKTGVDLWDWNTLQMYICDTYLGGKDYFEYFRDIPKEKEQENQFSFKFSKVSYNVKMKRAGNGTLIYAKIMNNTEANLDISLDLPTYISQENDQFDAIAFYYGYFDSGVIYAGCTVEACFVFDYDQLSHVKNSDKLVIKTTIGEEKTHVDFIYIEGLEPWKIEKKRCFIATAVYGSCHNSAVEVLRNWRDIKLANSRSGRLFIRFYYYISPALAYHIRDKRILRWVVRRILDSFVFLLKKR